MERHGTGAGTAVERGRGMTRLYVRVVWATLGGLSLLDPVGRVAAEGHLIALARRLDAEPVAVRVIPARVHILMRIPPGVAVAELVARLQSGSEALLRDAGRPVRWSRGYAAATVSPEAVRRAMRRIVRTADRMGGRRGPVPEAPPARRHRPPGARGTSRR